MWAPKERAPRLSHQPRCGLKEMGVGRLSLTEVSSQASEFGVRLFLTELSTAVSAAGKGLFGGGI